MNVFLSWDYRSVLKSRLGELKASRGSQFTVQWLADTIGVQRTYLSNVLNLKVHLNPDQLYLALSGLSFGEPEKEYLGLLLEWQRSNVKERREDLKKKILEIRETYSKTEKHFSSRIIGGSASDFQAYYLEPVIQLIHMFLTIPRFSKNLKLISEALQITEAALQHILDRLLGMKLIKVEGKNISVTEADLHLSTDSPLVNPYHQLAKFNAIQRLNKLRPKEKYSLSMIFTSKKDTADQIRGDLINFMKKLDKNVLKEEGSPTDVYQFSVDFFPWTD